MCVHQAPWRIVGDLQPCDVAGSRAHNHEAVLPRHWDGAGWRGDGPQADGKAADDRLVPPVDDLRRGAFAAYALAVSVLDPQRRGCCPHLLPGIPQNFISLNTTSNMLRHVYGRTRLLSSNRTRLLSKNTSGTKHVGERGEKGKEEERKERSVKKEREGTGKGAMARAAKRG